MTKNSENNSPKSNNISNENNIAIIKELIKKIECLKGLSEKSVNEISSNSKFLSFPIGYPINYAGIIPNEIIIILDGEARLISEENNQPITVAKLGQGSIIGLDSILRISGSGAINSSKLVKGLSIPDHLILKLYKNEISFRNWCDKNIFPGEVLSLAKSLIKQSNRTDIRIINSFNILFKHSEIISSKDGEMIKPLKDSSLLISSGNISNLSIGQVLEKSYSLEINSPFNSRILKIPTPIYNEFLKDNKKDNQANSLSFLKEEDDINYTQEIPQKSNINFETYGTKPKNKLIRATGEIKETLACLEMLFNQIEVPFRKDTLERVIREQSRRGKKISLQLCAELLSISGLTARGTKLNAELGTRLPTNAIILWKGKLALVNESNTIGLTLYIPRDGVINIKEHELSEVFNNGIEILIAEKTNITPNKKFNIEWFLPSLKKYRNSLLLVLVASFVVQLFGLANPLLIQVIIDKVISQRSLDTLQVLGIALVFVTILGGILGGLRTFLFAETTNRIDTRLGAEVIDHLLRLPLRYFDKRPVGELGTRVAELEKIREFLTGQALTTLLDAAFSVIYIVVMIIYSFQLTLLALGVVPIQIGLTLLGSPLLRRQIREVAKQNAQTQSHLIEVLTGIQTVKAQNIETISRWKWQDLYGGFISRTFEKTITGTALGQTSQVLQQLSQLLVLWFGATLVLKGQLTLGQLIAFRIISGYVTQPLLRLSSIWQNIQELKVSFERLADIIDTPEESSESDKTNITLPEIKGEVEFKNVSFSFNKGSENVLNNINLKISKGSFVGIAGQSGSGKSTLMKLMPRLYDLERGKIIIDSYDIKKVELYSLRRQIGVVPQEPLLFSGTISENIAINNPDSSSDEIIKAAKIACCHDFIMSLPEGYSTSVGERGSRLSGGQKQRLAIARTLLNNPKLLILDEATSALDYDTERQVCENLKLYATDITVFFITHRLNTIKNSDIIIMMEQGKLIESGDHSNLMNMKGKYYALYRQQESE